MAYQFKFTNLSSEEKDRLLEMRVPNHDERTDNDLWIKSASERIETDLQMAEEAVKVFLGKS